MIFHDPDTWRTRAACAGDDPNDWVWINSHSGRDRRRAERLKATCATCPVRTQCLDAELAAMRNGDTSYGVFGGLDAIERRQLLGMSTHSRQLHRPSTPMTHGTVAGYVKHATRTCSAHPAPNAAKRTTSGRTTARRHVGNASVTVSPTGSPVTIRCM